MAVNTDKNISFACTFVWVQKYESIWFDKIYQNVSSTFFFSLFSIVGWNRTNKFVAQKLRLLIQIIAQ